MRTCRWCYQKKKLMKVEIDKKTGVCFDCAGLSENKKNMTRKRVIREKIITALTQYDAMDAEQIAKKIRIPLVLISQNATALYNSGKIERKPHSKKFNTWIWKIRNENEDMDEDEDENSDDPLIKTTSKSLSINEIYRQLKATQIQGPGITDADLIWQAKYLAQAKDREMRKSR